MEEELTTIELVLDEDNNKDGIDAISLVHSPAIEENFIALSEHKVEFKAIDDDKRIVIGLALIPDKRIFRRRGEYSFYITFSKDTVRKASEMYMKRLKNNNTTLEHNGLTNGVSVVESWIVEDVIKDKTALYGLNATVGAWAVTMKVDNDDVWKDVKAGKYLGFSIEGYFSEKQEDISEDDKLLKKIEDLLQKIK